MPLTPYPERQLGRDSKNMEYPAYYEDNDLGLFSRRVNGVHRLVRIGMEKSIVVCMNFMPLVVLGVPLYRFSEREVPIIPEILLSVLFLNV